MGKRLRAFVICGPSGSGKSTLLKSLFEEYPEKFGFSVSHTTRNPRPGEINGVHYHFITLEEMNTAIANGDFLESAMFSNNMYGTSKKAVEHVGKSGKVCVLDIDVEGVKQVKKTDLNPIYVFVKPPSMVDLEQRLRDRGTETDDSLQRRLAVAQREMDYGDTPGNFDLVLINDSVEDAYAKFRDFIIPELDAEKNGE